MPTYEFLNKETGEFVDHIMSYKDLEEFKKNNPHLLQQLSAPKVISSHGLQGKFAKSGFNEVLSKVAEAHPNSNLADTHGNKSIKDIKTKEVVKKHIAKQNKK
tara:strand:+ start:920 stop:1228 length:309 start_codon:yes stop_codon:yes gene_type:complete